MITLGCLFIIGAIICWIVRFRKKATEGLDPLDFEDSNFFNVTTALFSIFAIIAIILMCLFFLP